MSKLIAKPHKVYALTGQLIEGKISNLEGRILTIIEATVEKEKLKAVKDLVFSEFRLTKEDVFKSAYVDEGSFPYEEEPETSASLGQVEIPKELIDKIR